MTLHPLLRDWGEGEVDCTGIEDEAVDARGALDAFDEFVLGVALEGQPDAGRLERVGESEGCLATELDDHRRRLFGAYDGQDVLERGGREETVSPAFEVLKRGPLDAKLDFG